MSDVFEIRRSGENWTLMDGDRIRSVSSPSRHLIEIHVLRWAWLMENKLTIRNDKELTAALERAEHLMGCTDGSDEERELEAIADAVDQFQQAIDVMRRVGRKVAQEAEDVTASVDGSE